MSANPYHDKLRSEGFLPGRIHYDGKRFYEWSDTLRGWNAASDAIGKLPRNNPSSAPLQLEFRYTVERFFYRTEETYQCGDHEIPCGLHYRVGIQQWVRLRQQDAA
jgi:hypothetical protein